MKHFIFCSFLSLILTTIGSNGLAQHLLNGAKVWEYEDGSIAVRFQGSDRFYTPAEQNLPPTPPMNPACVRQQLQAQISPNPYLETVTIIPGHTAGGANYTVDLSKYFSIRAIQIRVTRGSVQIYSAVIVDKLSTSTNVSSLTSLRLCQDQGLTSSITESRLSKLILKAEGYGPDSAISVNIQYSNATCGGCNSYGCYLQGGGCNSYGCFDSGNSCNSYGCSLAGGGCNSYGCWYAGGACNSYGCQKEAPLDAGKVSAKPVCE